MSLTDTALILAEGHIERPMQSVLDPPVAADDRCQAVDLGRQAANKVTHLVLSLAGAVRGAGHSDNAPGVRPASLHGGRGRHRLRSEEHTSELQSPMYLV